jgi:hypothetical protein
MSEQTEDAHQLLSPKQQMEVPKSVAIGNPLRKSRVSVSDLVAAFLCFCFFVAAVSSVQNTSFASRLGQSNQLIVVGFLLSLMGLCTSKQLQLLFVALEANSGKTTLQNLNAILSSNIISQKTRLRYRLGLLLQFITPLALSVGYKSFQGGSITSVPFTTSGKFGMTGPPGTQDTGLGLSLFANATLPWFDDPGFDRVYGFNMFVASEKTTLMLDGPLPAYVSVLQTQLSTGESMSITAEVTALLCDLQNGLSQSRESLNTTFINDLATQYAPAAEKWIGNRTYYVGVLTLTPNNLSTIWVSWWDESDNQTFPSQVREYNLNRQKVNGTWIITPDSISLHGVTIPEEPTLAGQSDVQESFLAVPELYITALTEYDWNYRKERLPYTNNTKYADFVKSDSSLVSSMVWSRITALGGPETGSNNTDLLYESEALAQISRPALRKNWALILILAINPLLFLLALTWRAFALYGTPVGEGFGLVSVLAAADTSTLGILNGAGLSGRLSKEVKMRFEVANDDNAEDSLRKSAKVKILFDEGGESGRLRSRYLYG